LFYPNPRSHALSPHVARIPGAIPSLSVDDTGKIAWSGIAENFFMEKNWDRACDWNFSGRLDVKRFTGGQAVTINRKLS
jgi:hypothetical protein